MTDTTQDTVDTDVKSFEVGAVLSVLTDRLLAANGIGDLYLLLEHLTGEPPMTHQLGRFSDEAKPFLAEQHPDLAAVVVPARESWTQESVAEFVASVSDQSHVDVTPIPQHAHQLRNPIEELAEMLGDKPIVVVAGDERLSTQDGER